MEHQQLGGDISEQAVTQFIELIRFLFSEIKPGGDPKAIFAFMQQALENPEALKRDLIAMVRTQDPEKIKSDALEISNGLRSPRKFVTGLIKDFIPAGRPGKRPQITEAKEQQMIQLGRSLLPAAEALIHLRQSATKKNHAGQRGISHSRFSGAGTSFVDSSGCRGSVLFSNDEAAQIASRTSKKAGFSGISEAVRDYCLLCGKMGWPFAQIRLKRRSLLF